MATGIGETLRSARRRRGASLADAAQETRVRETYLQALEEEEFGVLGGDVYVKGFLRSYAKFLGLDPEPLLAAYNREHVRSDEAVALAKRPVESVVREGPPGVGLVAAAALVVVVVLVLIALRGDDRPTGAALPPPPPVASPTVDVSPAATLPPASAPPGDGIAGTEQALAEAPAAAASEDVEVVVRVRGGPSWLRAVVDGETEVEGTQSDGETLTFVGREVALRIGDPGVVTILVNGEEQGRLGAPGVPVNRTYRAEGGA